MHESKVPDGRRVRSGDHRAELLSDEGRRLRHERRTGAGQHKRKDGVPLGRHDRQLRFQSH